MMLGLFLTYSRIFATEYRIVLLYRWRGECDLNSVL